MSLRRKLAASLAALTLVSGCAISSNPTSETSELLNYVKAGNSFSLNEVFDNTVARAYLFCPYFSLEDAVALGFDENQFPHWDRDTRLYEQGSGIGIIFNNGREPLVQWFDPASAFACPDNQHSGSRIDPDYFITITPGKLHGDENSPTINLFTYSPPETNPVEPPLPEEDM